MNDLNCKEESPELIKFDVIDEQDHEELPEYVKKAIKEEKENSKSQKVTDFYSNREIYIERPSQTLTVTSNHFRPIEGKAKSLLRLKDEVTIIGLEES